LSKRLLRRHPDILSVPCPPEAVSSRTQSWKDLRLAAFPDTMNRIFLLLLVKYYLKGQDEAGPSGGSYREISGNKVDPFAIRIQYLLD
jgi:hypothetical protein